MAPKMLTGDRSELLGKFKSQRVYLPDLRLCLGDWTTNISEHLDQLRVVVDERLEEVEKDPTKLAALKNADFAFFTSTWWPLAEFEQLKILSYFAIWLFLWDDEVDDKNGSLADDFEGAEVFRHHTIDFVEHSLRLQEHIFEEDLHPKITSFTSIGDVLCLVYTIEQRKLFLSELIFLMQMSKEEQEKRLKNGVYSLDQYWTCRLGTSAVYVGCAMIEFCYRLRLPVQVLKSTEMRALWTETNVIISITNDLLSLKKELNADVVANLVPILYLEKASVQDAIDQSVADLASAAKRFDEVAAQLMALSRNESTVEVGLRDFIRGCRFNCTGNLHWSLVTGRYGLGKVERDLNNGLWFDL